MAPVQQDEEAGGNRSFTLILAALILTVALLAVAIWGSGYRSGRESSSSSWTEETVPAKTQSTASVVPDP